MSKLAVTVIAVITMALMGYGSTEVMQPSVSVSVGQQLVDLKKARVSGALSDNDYRRQRQQLIDNVR